ncbi:PREDICTED: uncharacterized protein LOC109168219 [Ipomoea nil]|uniref:uncharacterized protein LOC109168219 n=1 Tax=Ipomoea nil TaxID=35883 RepID=UPI000901641F|nr:PREDICTED: uncharacterized protein LOC109168219 [Ipomoea nil]
MARSSGCSRRSKRGRSGHQLPLLASPSASRPFKQRTRLRLTSSRSNGGHHGGFDWAASGVASRVAARRMVARRLGQKGHLPRCIPGHQAPSTKGCTAKNHETKKNADAVERHHLYF